MTFLLDRTGMGLYIDPMNKLSTSKRAEILRCLVEGNSIRSTVRITGASKNTLAKLLADAGKACSAYHDKHVRNVKAERIQVDEIWSFCFAKQKNVESAKNAPDGAGDVWTWTAMDSGSKLVISWLVGGRDGEYALAFMDDLRLRLANRVQLTSDGHKAYLDAVEEAFGADIDYAQLIKMYGEPTGEKGHERKYSPSECTGTKKQHVMGSPDKKHISTSHVERQNLTMRLCMRRFTRLTNAFSKKIENHEASVALHFVYYNFCRIHQTLRVTPAMAAGVTDRLWDVEDLTKLLD
jgi:IS1 family transposase